jgi:hypothetical protein
MVDDPSEAEEVRATEVPPIARADARAKARPSVIFLSMVVPCGFVLLSCG